MKDTRLRLMQDAGVSLVLDVGGNAGQYSRVLGQDG